MALAVSSVSLFASELGAATVLSDGSTLTRSDPADGTDDVQLSNGSEAIITGTGEANGTNAGAFGTAGISARGGTNVSVTGGAVQGGRGSDRGASGIETREDFNARDERATVAVTGGTVTGGNSRNGGSFGGSAIRTSEDSDITITGGTLLGGNGSTFGGNGIWLSEDSTLLMTGGSVTGGRGSSFFGQSSALRAFDTAMARVLGGTLSGGVETYDSATAEILGGTITGGLNVSDNSSLILSGGMISGRSFVDTSATLTVIGRDLVFDETAGRLTGFFEDGNALNIALSVGNGGTLDLRSISAVPLPAGLPMLLAAIGAFALLRRRQATA